MPFVTFWEVGYEAMSLATFKPEAPPSRAALLEPVLGGPLLALFCRANR